MFDAAGAGARLEGRKMSETEPTLKDIWVAVQGISRKLDEHSRILDEHSRILDEHSRILGEHSRILGEHSRILGEHSRILGEHSRILGEHSRRFDAHDRVLDGLAHTVQDVWALLGVMNRRHSERFDAIEQQLMRQREEFAQLKGQMTTSIGALKESIEARDFRLDEHGRRLTELETPRP